MTTEIAATESDSMVNAVAEKRKYLDLTPSEWFWPLAGLLCMSLVGLAFPLGYIGLVIWLIDRFRKDRYDFLIMITIFFGGYAFTSNTSYPFKTYDIALILSLLCLVILKKTEMVKKTLYAFGLYVLALLALAKCSDERMTIQLLILKNYTYFIYFLVPFLVFANHSFDIRMFFRRVMPYAIIICVFYAIDGLILSGNIFIPNSFLYSGRLSRFYDLVWEPFSLYMLRKYPPGLYWLALCIIPIIRYYKLRPWQWIVFVLALLSSRTFTVISGLIFIYVIFQGKFKKVAWYLLLAFVLGAVLYTVDVIISGPAAEQSFMRISSSINQLTAINSFEDEEDLAELGSGRMAQALPKLALVFELNKQYTGLGFLHPEYTTNPKYIIRNEFYSDVSKAEELSTGIEVEILQIFVNIGFIGIIVYAVFWSYICYLIRHMPYRRYFYSVMLCMLWFGIGGFATLSQPMGLLLAGLVYGLVLLENKTTLETAQSIGESPNNSSAETEAELHNKSSVDPTVEHTKVIKS